jgi:DNA-binding transcriptional MocR family regulator
MSVGRRTHRAALLALLSLPLSVTMNLARRLELLRLAGRSGAWVIADDYDSDYR